MAPNLLPGGIPEAHLHTRPRRGCGVPTSFAGGFRSCSPVSRLATKPPICGRFFYWREPSGGLEPSTPSLPWRPDGPSESSRVRGIPANATYLAMARVRRRLPKLRIVSVKRQSLRPARVIAIGRHARLPGQGIVRPRSADASGTTCETTRSQWGAAKTPAGIDARLAAGGP
jgi:hypothetical protein